MDTKMRARDARERMGKEGRKRGCRGRRNSPVCRVLTLATQRLLLHTLGLPDIQALRKDHSDGARLAGRALRTTQDRSCSCSDKNGHSSPKCWL